MIWFISDAHLSGGMYVHRPLIKGDSYRALDSITADILSKDQPGSVIFCGDNFNTPKPSPEDVQHMTDVINCFREKGIPVYAVQGNHDLCCGLSWMHICGALDLTEKVHDIEGRRVCGLDYTPGTKIIDELNRIDGEIECDILVIHQAFRHLSPFDTFSLSIEDVPGSVLEAVVSGHIHVPDKRDNSAGVSIVSPGATHPCNIAEPPGTYIQYDGTAFMHISTPVSRPIKKLVIEKEEDIQGVLEYLESLKYLEDKSPDEWPLVRIRYASELIELIRKLSKFKSRCHLFIEAVTAEVPDVSEVEVSIAASTEDILKQCIDEHSLEYKTILGLTDGNYQVILENINKAFIERLERIQDEIKKAAPV